MEWWEKIIKDTIYESELVEADKAFIEAIETMVMAGVNYRGAILYHLSLLEFMGIDSRRWEAMSRELWGDDFSGGVSV